MPLTSSALKGVPSKPSLHEYIPVSKAALDGEQVEWLLLGCPLSDFWLVVLKCGQPSYKASRTVGLRFSLCVPCSEFWPFDYSTKHQPILGKVLDFMLSINFSISKSNPKSSARISTICGRDPSAMLVVFTIWDSVARKSSFRAFFTDVWKIL